MKKTKPMLPLCGASLPTIPLYCSDNLINRLKTLRFIPMLMTTQMVGASMAGRKQMTRRLKGLELVNQDPDHNTFLRMQEYPDGTWRALFQSDDSDEPGSIKCPYGKAGDILWIRETFQHVDIPDDFTGYVYKIPGGKDWEMANEEWTWKPGIHMPKEACRLFLLIKDIRVERLHDITQKDAKLEGATQGIFRDGPNVIKKQFQLETHCKGSPIGTYGDGFKFLWMQINGPDNWNLNPWVWVITFEQCNVTFVPDLKTELCARTATKK